MSVSYDDIPYLSKTFPQTRPSHLYMIGKLFGMTPPDFGQCRVLEIGCADGGNIIPLATNWPKAEFTGVDLSGKQIETGQAIVAKLGLKNIHLRHTSIEDFQDDSKYDYIICHGVFSWVAKSIQEEILRLIKQSLTSQGVALVSYNTLPGWNMLRSLRDMMLYETTHLNTPAEKVAQARGLLTFIQQNASNCPASYQRFLAEEAETLAKQPDHYLIHEHLEENNHAFYFHEFMREATRHGLSYLGDTQLKRMFAGNMPEAARKELSKITGHIQQEQYMDFLTNRRFRSTLLCHDDVVLNRKLSPQSLDNLYFGSLARSQRGLTPGQFEGEIAFLLPGGDNKIISRQPVATAILHELYRSRQQPISLSTLVQRVQEHLPGTASDQITSVFYRWALPLALNGTLILQADEWHYATDVADNPTASPLAQLHAKDCDWVANQRHESVSLNLFSRLLLGYLDGTRNRETLLQMMVKHFKSGELTLAQGDHLPMGDEDHQAIAQMIGNQLKRFAEVALLLEEPVAEEEKP